MAPYEEVAVPAAPAVAVELLRDALRARNIREYAVVDHGHDMTAAGAPGHPAWTVIFGSPAAGEKVLASDVRAAVDIPLRLAVIGDGGDASTLVLRPMASLIGPQMPEVAEMLTGVLRALAEAVREAATAPA